jgi:hypothetical protein
MTDRDELREPVLPKVIAGGAVAAASLRLGPEAAVALGMMGYKFEVLAERSWAELQPQAKRRAGKVLEVAAAKLDCDDDHLGKLISKSDETSLMTGVAMLAAERTAWPRHITALGRLLADGLIAEGDRVDIAQFALGAMSDLSRLDVLLLDLLTPSKIYRQQFSHAEQWLVDASVWEADAIVSERPELATVLHSVAGTLTRHGLAVQIDRTREAMEQLSKELNRQADSGRREPGGLGLAMPRLTNMSTIRFTDRRWGPTELGAVVLDYYLEAAQEDQNPPPDS